MCFQVQLHDITLILKGRCTERFSSRDFPHYVVIYTKLREVTDTQTKWRRDLGIQRKL